MILQTSLPRVILRKIIFGFTVLEAVDSSINKKIEIREDLFGRKSLSVGGMEQSGGKMEKIWKRVFKKLRNKVIKNCLILGLGAGNAARLVGQLYPKVRIVGVEIDSLIIDLGRKYFNLNSLNNLEVVIGEAIEYSTNYFPDLNYENKTFDLILVDLFIGAKYPLKAEKSEFLKSLKKMTSPDGIIVFNKLYYTGREKKATDNFEKKLKKFFEKVESLKIIANKVFLCSFS